jgi:hypothetical protein
VNTFDAIKKIELQIYHLVHTFSVVSGITFVKRLKSKNNLIVFRKLKDLKVFRNSEKVTYDCARNILVLMIITLCKN